VRVASDILLIAVGTSMVVDAIGDLVACNTSRFADTDGIAVHVVGVRAGIARFLADVILVSIFVR
jgi:hypothetical protein